MHRIKILYDTSEHVESSHARAKEIENERPEPVLCCRSCLWIRHDAQGRTQLEQAI